uniref:pyrroloquinoline-quinone synthase PqqC n=1 Tax=Aureimonas psammosilenae TaxID=2495496 RepID=UPI0012612141|nr:pyrroloquinoline-quinone synthase PqqC [Aureimonas psammosilenae]
MTPDFRLDRTLAAAELEDVLRQVGAERYHIRHPFHRLMVEGRLTREQMQAWALNRYCYQAVIPRKDAIILSRIEDRALRLSWRERILDHDGDGASPGGIERWMRLATGLGLDAQTVASQRLALPATRFCVGAYLTLVEKRTLLEAIASSLTEMFSPEVIGERVSAILERYPYVDADTLDYFTPRLAQAPRDVDVALAYVREHARTMETQQLVVDALIAKCEILWTMLDALYFSYVEPGITPPGAFAPEAGR